MAFVDTARIHVKAGGGGKGCESHYRDLWMRYPTADGGNGGDGGTILFVANPRIHTLLDYRFKQHYQGERGGHGGAERRQHQHVRRVVVLAQLRLILKPQKVRGCRRGLPRQRLQSVLQSAAAEEQHFYLTLCVRGEPFDGPQQQIRTLAHA